MTQGPNEPAVRVHVLGCGDVFGSGGRLHTCFFIDSEIGILLDCGASVLPAMKRVGLDGNRVDTIVRNARSTGCGSRSTEPNDAS